MKIIITLIAPLLCTFTAFPQRTSTATGCDYDASKNITHYFVVPYGSADIPGKWEKEHYNKVSGQQFFTNKDSISLAIAFQSYKGYEFNPKGKLKGFDFVKAFYEWDSKYLIDRYELKRTILVSDSINRYIIYRIYGKQYQASVDTYFLIGEKNGNTSNFSISITDKWSENEKVEFLKKLCLEKN